MPNYYLFPIILVTVILNTVGQTLLKLGAGQGIFNLFLISGLSAYVLSTGLYIIVLGKLNLSITYPTVIGLTVISTTISGAYFLKEQIPSVQWIGIGLLISGISAIAFGKTLS